VCPQAVGLLPLQSPLGRAGRALEVNAVAIEEGGGPEDAGRTGHHGQQTQPVAAGFWHGDERRLQPATADYGPLSLGIRSAGSSRTAL